MFTRRKGEDGGLLKQNNGSHGGTVGAQSDGACLPILLAIYIQSVYLKVFIKRLKSQNYIYAIVLINSHNMILGVIFQVKGNSYSFMFYKAIQDS